MLNDYLLLDEINNTHKVYLVKNKNDNCFYVEKILSVYDLDVYEYLLNKSFYGIPKVVEIVKDDNDLVVFEEYISGLSLQELLDKGYFFSVNEIRAISITLCRIMSNLNNNVKIVHRDIKPSNIIKNNKMYFLIDFNAAKFIDESKQRDTILLGTEGYAAPEQYGFGSSTVQTDIYSIGKLISELANNNLSNELKNIVDKCCQIDPKNRYSSFKELELALAKKTKGRYTIVGYRSHNPLKMILASAYYLFMLFATATLTSTSGNQLDIWFSKIAFFIVTFSLPQISFNYQNFHKKMGLDNFKLPIKILLIILIDIFFILTTTLAFAILFTLISALFQ